MAVAHVPLDGAWSASQIAVADFNGDGHEDVLVTRNAQDAQHTFPVAVLLGDGAGRTRHGHRCIRLSPIRGHFIHTDAAGTTRFQFTGQVDGHALKAGDYRLNATPTSVAGQVGRTVRTRFRIVGQR